VWWNKWRCRCSRRVEGERNKEVAGWQGIGLSGGRFWLRVSPSTPTAAWKGVPKYVVTVRGGNSREKTVATDGDPH
jgi:hypothetical protein